MNLFEMAQIPLNKAIEVMKLDPNAAAIIACGKNSGSFHSCKNG